MATFMLMVCYVQFGEYLFFIFSDISGQSLSPISRHQWGQVGIGGSIECDKVMRWLGCETICDGQKQEGKQWEQEIHKGTNDFGNYYIQNE